MMTQYDSHKEHSIRTLQEASERHGEGLRILTGFDTEAPLTLRLARQAGIPQRVLAIDTGFWFDETHAYRRRVEALESITDSVTFGPSEEAVRDIADHELWSHDLAPYNRITKLEPLTRAVRDLGITALVTGVRRSQTANRQSLRELMPGNDGEIRVNAVLEWTDSDVDEYFNDEQLPVHPLLYDGYESVGDWPITRPGKGRSGRLLGEKSECGLHLPSDNTQV